MHGEDQVTDSFAETVTERFDIPAFAPYSGGCVDLATNQILSKGSPDCEEESGETREIESRKCIQPHSKRRKISA